MQQKIQDMLLIFSLAICLGVLLFNRYFTPMPEWFSSVLVTAAFGCAVVSCKNRDVEPRKKKNSSYLS
jgi:hypothetical protein